MAKLKKSLEEWREQLSEAQFRVCRLGETERAGSGAYYHCDKPGIYTLRLNTTPAAAGQATGNR